MSRTSLLKTLRLLATLFVTGWLVRSVAFGLFAIPSVSMLPGLWPGDYLLVAKWPYGWSRYGLIGGAPLFAGRLAGALPARGDVVVIRDDDRNVVKRVIGLPGDRIALDAGAVSLNGRPLPRLRIGDFVMPTGPDDRCGGVGITPDGCRYHRYAETLPGLAPHPVLDGGITARDRMAERRVPADSLFLMGDNRDESADSRLARDDGGLGMIPADRLLGRATVLLWSTDGSGRWHSPRSWWRATRWDRIGRGIR
ncbi:MAG TPA: signal peptidase I [Sphingomonas sp.]|jgi:signal peptidase I|uniref:signal peptidase I n=1 Tax=Sphingomonas sp. TaxID=28214 RepID=UPI002ED9FC65